MQTRYYTYKDKKDNLNGIYYPSTESSIFKHTNNQKSMILDDITLANLDVINPIISNGSVNDIVALSLYDRLSALTSTSMGKRLLTKWLCSPLNDIIAINNRLDGVEALASGGNDRKLLDDVSCMAKSLPDLERLLQKIHGLSYSRPASHPESQAVMFEEATYSKRKIEEFVSTLKGFNTVCQLIGKIDHERVSSSKLLSDILNAKKKDGENVWTFIDKFINDFTSKYDFEKAKSNGVLIPEPGIVPEYDEADENAKILELDLHKYLKKQEKAINCKLVYWGTGKNRFQMEIPESHYKKVPDYFEIKSQRKGAKRYRTKEIESMLQSLTEYEYRRDQGLSQSMRKIFAKFDQNSDIWNFAVHAISRLDVLIAFARYSFYEKDSNSNNFCVENRCRPIIVTKEKPYIKIRGSSHPCLNFNTFSGGDYIPNDININCEETKSLIVITGPNMGGKSTLLRQVGLVTILAHVGCYVSAEFCEMSLVDRIYTRLGAKDNIIKGESTFFVELKETSAILTHATINSLVLMDELGRGTATYDGVAIADSVIKYIRDNIKCRTLFSTHYHSLVDELKHRDDVSLAHMACMIETSDDSLFCHGDQENEKDIDQEKELYPDKNVLTFLYKLSPGPCPNSYGFHAALLAGMRYDIVNKAYKVAKNFENEFVIHTNFNRLLQCIGNIDVKNISKPSDDFDDLVMICKNIQKINFLI
ncbi:unnamed protein product [Gordionus sp. m RMFG-2023]